VEQKLDLPKTEIELRALQEHLYATAKDTNDKGKRPSFKGLLEIILAEPTIVTAIHNIKANRGSKTSGSDGETMQNILENNYQVVIQRVRETARNYRPRLMRRVYIPKQGKAEKRSFGIPSIIDRIIQECVRIVIEPILEAQFFKHSYGFRPMRSTDMAMARVSDVVHKTGHYWIIEGDISKYFDFINHTVLLKRLYHMGIKDRRVLMLSRQMLKAGIMGELHVNTMGIPQGGIISPLLANVYLHTFDEWVAKQWEDKKLRFKYATRGGRSYALRNSSLKAGYLVRYVDDWVLITDSRENAEKWIWKIRKFLKNVLKLDLSDRKTTITDIRRKSISFLGFKLKGVKGKAKNGYITRSIPDEERLRAKIKEIHNRIKRLRKVADKNRLILKITLINSAIRGIIQYYESATWVYKALARHRFKLDYAGYKALKGLGGEWIPANQTVNLLSVHKAYSAKIAAVIINGMCIGITSLGFNAFKKGTLKNQDESPYSTIGRNHYFGRTGKKPLLARADELTTLDYVVGAAFHAKGIYNFEFLMNRAYAYNRDKGKCRVCGNNVHPQDAHTHHINNSLPLSQINKVMNLMTAHKSCHMLIHSNDDLNTVSSKVRNMVLGLRERLG